MGQILYFTIWQDAPVGRGLTRQQKASKAEMIDSYRNAPPHQVKKSWVCI